MHPKWFERIKHSMGDHIGQVREALQKHCVHFLTRELLEVYWVSLTG